MATIETQCSTGNTATRKKKTTQAAASGTDRFQKRAKKPDMWQRHRTSNMVYICWFSSLLKHDRVKRPNSACTLGSWSLKQFQTICWWKQHAHSQHFQSSGSSPVIWYLIQSSMLRRCGRFPPRCGPFCWFRLSDDLMCSCRCFKNWISFSKCRQTWGMN